MTFRTETTLGGYAPAAVELKARIIDYGRGPLAHRYLTAFLQARSNRRVHPFGAAGARQRARLRGAEGSHTSREWRAPWMRHSGRCAYCGRPDARSHDHLLPLERGGTDYAANLLPACDERNASKQDMLLAEWRHRRNCAPALNRLIRARPRNPLP